MNPINATLHSEDLPIPLGVPMEITMEAVTCTLGGITVLKNVTCHIAPGTIWGLIGPNGAGKSTWLRSLLGLISPFSGFIKIGPWNPTRQARKIRQHCTALLSPNGLYDHLTAEEHLELVARIWHMPRTIVMSRIK